MNRRSRGMLLVVLVLVAIGAVAVGFDERPTSAPPDGTTDTATGDEPTSNTPNGPTVTIVDNGTTLGTVDVRVADSFQERYTGLSNTESLGPNEGMLFVHGSEGQYTYVMRDMAFPIDIVYIDSNHRITTIHHAPVEDPPLTEYRGRGKWVLEVPSNWTTNHGVEVGHHVRINRPSN